MTYKETLLKCRELGLDAESTRLMLWNEAYNLGRSRWYLGSDVVDKLEDLARRATEKTAMILSMLPSNVCLQSFYHVGTNSWQMTYG